MAPSVVVRSMTECPPKRSQRIPAPHVLDAFDKAVSAILVGKPPMPKLTTRRSNAASKAAPHLPTG